MSIIQNNLIFYKITNICMITYTHTYLYILYIDKQKFGDLCEKAEKEIIHGVIVSTLDSELTK